MSRVWKDVRIAAVCPEPNGLVAPELPGHEWLVFGTALFEELQPRRPATPEWQQTQFPFAASEKLH